jgi:hypothetical protein
VVEYLYIDPITGRVIEKLKLVFTKPVAKIKTKKPSNEIFAIPAHSNYTIEYNQYINKLIEQINKLQVDKNIELISCSLRVLFEISIDVIDKSNKFSTLFNNINNLDERVIKIITYIKNNGCYKKEISNNSKIDYKSLRNILSVDDYKRIIKKTHLGAHKSTIYITETDIHDIIKYLSVFIVLTNEMLKNSNIT